MSNNEMVNELTDKIIDIEKEAMRKHLDIKNNNSTYSNKAKINDNVVSSIIKELDKVCGGQDDN